MILIDINSEEGEAKVNPPQKFFQPDFLAKLVEITTDEGGLIAYNTIIDEANRKKVVTTLKTLPGCVKFASGMQEELNEVFFLAKGTFTAADVDRLEETEQRQTCMNRVINALKLPKALLLNKEKMQVAYHVDEMRKI